MRAFLLTLLTAFVINANGQVSFSPVDSRLKTQKSDELTELICSGSTMSVKFQSKRKLTVMPQNNFVKVDSQVIQIIPLQFSGYTGTNEQSLDNQKELLNTYSKYELQYFKNDLGIEVINPNNQWVVTKSKGWFIWYFRVGSAPVQAAKQTRIQLFASTVIGDKILTINAPIMADGDFGNAGIIVNEMMETLTVTKQ